MYSTVIVFQCLFLFQATMADSTMDLLKLSVSNQVLVLNSQIKDLKVLVEHQNTQFAKENLKLANLETKIGNLESEIARLTHSEVTTTKPLLTTTSSPTTSTRKTAPLTTMRPTEPSTTTPFSVGIKDQALLLHIKDQDIKIEHQNTKLEHQNTQIAELKVLVEHQNSKFERENAEVKTKMYKLESEIGQLTNSQATTTSSPSTSTSTIDTSSGVVFTRWGRRDCPAGISTPVYNGTVGGSNEGHTGAAVNYLCMPNQPTWDNNKLFKTSFNGYVYSVSYGYLPDSSLATQVATCAVCRAELFSTKVMIPGRDTCFPGWTKAYSGELVSGRHDFTAASEYTCLDRQPQKAGSGGSIGFWFNSVLAKCGFSYPDDALLTCVVCLK